MVVASNNIPMQPIITTERLILRPLTLDDLPALLAINTNPVMEQWLSTSSEAQTKTLIECQIEHQKQYGFSFLACTLKDGTFIGLVGLHNVRFQAHFTPAVEIGWRIAPAYQGHGYATEAARAVLAYGFNTLGLAEIVAFTVPHNSASRRVMEKIGMTHDATDDFRHPRLPEDHPLSMHVLYRISRKQP